MNQFVNKDSIVREVWGNSDTILLVFAGASAEFALNKAVDWLYFTGKLPKDPLGRLFSTVNYAKLIVFSEKNKALKAIDQITAIHTSVEKRRGQKIPDWAYKDVLFMLIDYSIRAFELLNRRLTLEEKQEVLDVFRKVGMQMKLHNLPLTYSEFENARHIHLQENLEKSELSKNLYKQYKKHLGIFRYYLLLETQILLVPKHVRSLLQLGSISFLKPMVSVFKIFRSFHLDWIVKELLLPPAYKRDIKHMNIT